MFNPIDHPIKFHTRYENFEVSLWDIVTTIHPWTAQNDYERPEFPEMGIHPATEVWQRGMPMWNL